jgi:hypothetical protein
MPRLQLANVTLCAADTRLPAIAAEALQRSMAGVDFGRVLLFTHGFVPAEPLPGIEIIDIGPLRSAAEYSHFVLRRLPAFVQSSHVLVTQWDGFVTHPEAWTDEFLAVDYIGAVWDDQPAEMSVGNGGFSLRSQRLLQAGLDVRITEEHPEDEMLARRHRAMLEQDHGVRFAPPALARRFAFENETPAAPTFGFHGPKNLPAVLDEATLSGWLAQLPGGFYAGRDARRLARALMRHGMADLAQTVIRRRSAAGRDDLNNRLLGATASVLQAWQARRER